MSAVIFDMNSSYGSYGDISAIVYVWATIHNSGQKCLLLDRPDFVLNIKFDCISCYISFHRFSGMLMSFLAVISMFGPPYTIQAKTDYCLIGLILV